MIPHIITGIMGMDSTISWPVKWEDLNQELSQLSTKDAPSVNRSLKMIFLQTEISIWMLYADKYFFLFLFSFLIFAADWIFYQNKDLCMTSCQFCER